MEELQPIPGAVVQSVRDERVPGRSGVLPGERAAAPVTHSGC